MRLREVNYNLRMYEGSNFWQKPGNSSAVLQSVGKILSGKLCTSLRTCTQEKNELYKEGFTNWQWQRGRVYMLTYIRNRKCNGISFACKSWASQKDCSNLVSLGGNAKFKGNESLSINLSEMWIKLAMPTCSSQRSPTAALRKDIPRLKHQTVTTIIERTPSIF